MSSDSFHDCPDPVRNHVFNFFSPGNDRNQTVQRGDPLFHSELVLIQEEGGRTRHLRVVVFNAPALLPDAASLDSSHADVTKSSIIAQNKSLGPGQERKGTPAEAADTWKTSKNLMAEAVRGGNIMGALANMMWHSKDIAKKYNFEAEEDAEKAGKLFMKLSEDVRNLLNSEEVKPLVDTVMNVMSRIGQTPINEETAKLIVHAFIVKESAARARINWAKVAGVASVASSISGVLAGVFLPFPFNLVVGGVLLVSGFAAGAGGLYLRGSSDKLVMSHAEMFRFGQYCKLLSDLNDLVINRPDYVERNNAMVFVYDDIHDFEELVKQKPWYRSMASVAEAYNPGEAFCDFVNVPSNDIIAPRMGSYRNRNGLNTLEFLTEASRRFEGSQRDRQTENSNRDDGDGDGDGDGDDEMVD